MDKHFQEELHLTLSQSAWVQFAHYLGYFLMSLPAGWLAIKLGYKGGIIAGLLMVAVGGFWFIPATHIASFWAFLLGVCIIAAGLTFLYSKIMLVTGILNPQLLSLLARVRHTNTLVIADRGFPFWPTVETVDISLVDGVPTVLQVLAALRANFVAGQAHMAQEFLDHNGEETRAAFARGLEGVPTAYLAHEAEFKPRVPRAIGLIRTGDTTPYANVILTSA